MMNTKTIFFLALIAACFFIQHIAATSHEELSWAAFRAVRNMTATSAATSHEELSWAAFRAVRNMTAGQLTTSGLDGVDISQQHTVSSLRCLVNNNYKYLIVRGYKSSGSLDTAMAVNMDSAVSAGFPVPDVYMFPCPTCAKTAADQVEELWAAVLKAAPTFKGLIWLDIEGSQYWHTDKNKNIAFYEAMIAYAVKKNIPIGIYCNQTQWNEILGSSYKPTNHSYPLWVARYNGSKVCTDLAEFGPYKQKDFTIKQWKGTTSTCGASVDLNITC